MAALPRATSFGLAGGGLALLERTLEGGATAVRESCADRFSDSVCALSFVYVEEGFAPRITYLGALTVGGRAALFGSGEAKGLALLWSPADWDHWDFFAGTPEEMDGDLERLGGLLGEAGCDDPEGAYLCELAWRLSRADWSAVMKTSPDFACWTMEHEGSGGPAHETFRVTAREEAVERYERRGWLPASRASRERPVARTMREMGASEGQALELLTIMRDLFEPEEIIEWLNDPSELPGPDRDDLDSGPGLTAREALARGRADLVLAAARNECGEDL